MEVEEIFNRLRVDYQMAFDSVPHFWIKKCLEINRTILNLQYAAGNLKSRPIQMRSEIFQGDFAPLSNLLNNAVLLLV